MSQTESDLPGDRVRSSRDRNRAGGRGGDGDRPRWSSDRTAPATVTDVVSPDHAQHLRLLGRCLFAGTQALDEKELADRLPNDADVKRLLADLAEVCRPRGQRRPGRGRLHLPHRARPLEKLKIERR